MTNEQAVIQAEKKIEDLKQDYMNHLNPIVVRKEQHGEEPSLQDLLKCQELGAKYFNFIEKFVGDSGLLGAHANGKWVTGFAETCLSVLNAFEVHINFLRSHSDVFSGALAQPDLTAYANMQRMVKEYLPKSQWKQIESLYREKSLPISGFEYEGVNDLNKKPHWKTIVGLVIGVSFTILIILLAVVIPEPTKTQFFIFRGVFSISLSAISAIIPGLLNVESRYKKLSIRATGAIAIFIIVWLCNPPALIGNSL
ncbi:hypothetical protein [Phocoenobacter skyensis]|uniref:Uncharacterized protein n=1 Tax=Phocoenobacter skyensis TaxID=97481 RepID=A0A1H7WPM6_9PAST|nr:hypothetical protein [Pasteurella skyensis]MDP8078975.1 hypothetical protein [Pasteurella skyensis]MDP8084925.1 hypothetical protein [Pasteurella skyensis]MDP8185227.1 hypothetical protein [Pasteurella skyensis]QLB23494.1 hypothetical protein A6B44_09900 [Pasteurella skyensis]SEM22969.1 hypothetical protein SAMN05444853_10928 [Pasteurella skyensis]